MDAMVTAIALFVRDINPYHVKPGYILYCRFIIEQYKGGYLGDLAVVSST